MRAVKPTRAQKLFIENHRLDSRNWLVLKDTDKHMVLANRLSGNVRTIKKGAQ